MSHYLRRIDEVDPQSLELGPRPPTERRMTPAELQAENFRRFEELDHNQRPPLKQSPIADYLRDATFVPLTFGEQKDLEGLKRLVEDLRKVLPEHQSRAYGGGRGGGKAFQGDIQLPATKRPEPNL